MKIFILVLILKFAGPKCLVLSFFEKGEREYESSLQLQSASEHDFNNIIHLSHLCGFRS